MDYFFRLMQQLQSPFFNKSTKGNFMIPGNSNVLFKVASHFTLLQNTIIKLLNMIHPSMEHNIEKFLIIKKALFFCELEDIEGSYFEFGVYEGSSLYSAVQFHHRMKSKFQRNFLGFDSFEDGFKYYTQEDIHPFFQEGDFRSSYAKVAKRLANYSNVKLIKGLFEESINGKNPIELCGESKCAIAFIDCDLMHPTIIALNFIKPILQKGTILIIDDYWAYRGSQKQGTCGGLNDFLKNNSGINIRPYMNYGHGGMSFIIEDIFSN
jgi:hypothetical protein